MDIYSGTSFELSESFFNLDQFISEHVIKRQQSMFLNDIKQSEKEITEKISGKSVLVIGGAGSIGSSFIKCILPFRPSSLVVVDLNENALAELSRDLRSSLGLFIPDDYIPYPMDFSSNAFKKMFLNRRGFDIVANFSAHKHVRSEKDVYSIEALIRNNVLNAKKLMDLLAEFPPEEYFCVSTDKAANPVNIMGASKRIMEDLIFCYSDRFPVKTARFANVAFSNGSLPASFLVRMQKQQPLSAPSDVKRYFVSPQESGQICMLSCVLGNNREIFFPKLDKAQMMTFDQIATELLLAHGYKVLKCESDEEAIQKAEDLKKGSKYYPVHFSISDTSGEKGFEEFVTENEHVDMERFSSLGVIIDKTIPDNNKLENVLKRLGSIFETESVTKEEVVHLIQEYLPNFAHIEKGRSLDHKM